jgi:hypothetical protein
MSLESALNTWNGHPDDLQAIFRQFKLHPDFTEQLLPLLKQKQQRGASELLKLCLLNQRPLSEAEVEQVFRSLGLIQHWQTQENLLACLPYLHPYPKSKQAALAHFIHNALHSSHKSVAVLAQQAIAEYEQDFPNQPIAQFLSAEEKAMEAKPLQVAQAQTSSLF